MDQQGKWDIFWMLRHLRLADDHLIQTVAAFWTSGDLLRVVPWKYSDDGPWALHINLAQFGFSGQEAYLPVAWAESEPPTLAEALEVFRSTTVEYKDTSSRSA